MGDNLQSKHSENLQDKPVTRESTDDKDSNKLVEVSSPGVDVITKLSLSICEINESDGGFFGKFVS